MTKRDSPAVSHVARAAATEALTFDSTLTEEQIAAIARRIDENRSAARALRLPSEPLTNADEPVTRFMLDDARIRS